jgi:hypothetical protein
LEFFRKREEMDGEIGFLLEFFLSLDQCIVWMDGWMGSRDKGTAGESEMK